MKSHLMNLLRPLRFIQVIVITVIMASCGPSIEPAFSTEQSYERDLLSREECTKRLLLAEISCTESARFKSDRKVSLFLGGSDMGLQGNYQRKGRRIIIKPEFKPDQQIVFEVINDNEIKRIETGDVWVKR
jgi:hypothetical protein